MPLQLVHDCAPLVMQLPHVASHGAHAVPVEKNPAGQPALQVLPSGWMRSSGLHWSHAAPVVHWAQLALHGRHCEPVR